ncbi:probable bifunctional methylthioribulose-1-phosphate dehydratase/enolase-phosphatase E1 [Prosopis cineraria]|uniref:probable bifunctional methylthioribulose-1-phosphate dehydratase/enolase-phosphatase E1 n=1 Tax=Prosopis cineraria TaxID=364024 RepID=UPI00240F94FE|nr:probable bifunctional methylthioribulose-1-phosphate dehydratase/enolase-phosphatase E1 [Prosopis cineraria]
MDSPSSLSRLRIDQTLSPPQSVAEGGVPLTSSPSKFSLFLKNKQVTDTMALVADLCRQFYTMGWVSGTGGAMSVNLRHLGLIVITPSGVQKERMTAEDMFVVSSDGSDLLTPTFKPYPHKPPKPSDCAPLFMKIYEMRNAGAIIHSHAIEACLVSVIKPLSRDFRISHMEMIKGIEGHGYCDELIIPIIENAEHERALINSITEALEAYPRTTAVLVRNHGVFIWGESWIKAKTQAECYHYLFDAAIKLHQLGQNWSTPRNGPIERSSIS